MEATLECKIVVKLLANQSGIGTNVIIKCSEAVHFMYGRHTAVSSNLSEGTKSLHFYTTFHYTIAASMCEQHL